VQSGPTAKILIKQCIQFCYLEYKALFAWDHSVTVILLHLFLKLDAGHFLLPLYGRARAGHFLRILLLKKGIRSGELIFIFG